MEEQHSFHQKTYMASLRSILFPAFWGFSSIEGLICFIWFLNLPLSESERAVFLGYSIIRLIALAVFGLAVVYCVIVFLKTLVQSEQSRSMQAAIQIWIRQKDFSATALLSCLFAWALLGAFLEIFLNPSFFPRSILYAFLYTRIRPVFLWTVLVSAQAFITILAGGWYQLKAREQPEMTGKRIRTAAAGFFLLTGGSLVLWTIYLTSPDQFINPDGFILPAIASLAVLLLGLVFILQRSEV